MEFLRFCAVGTLGFLVDSGLTVIATRFWGLGPTAARLLAFAVAATLTWALNRRFTFRSSAGAASWLPYFGLTAFGAVINVGVYRLWVAAAGSTPEQLVVGVAFGSVVALGFNWTVSRYIVFRVEG